MQIVGVLVLLAAGQANGKTLKEGIVGDSHIKPYNIVIIFMSQARRLLLLATPSCQRVPTMTTGLGSTAKDADHRMYIVICAT